MKETWSVELSRIQESVPLPVWLESCPAETWQAWQSHLAAEGREVLRHTRVGDTVWAVVIERDAWPESARSLLELLLSPPGGEQAAEDAVVRWLRSAYHGDPVDLPGPFGTTWPVPRACFVLERTRQDGTHADWSAWENLLSDFFSDRHAVSLHPLSSDTVLLLVPLSHFPDAETGAIGRAQWLEWAAGLHDVLSTELMEQVRVWVDEPAADPHGLAEALRRMGRLSRAMRACAPQVMVAGTWQHLLEQWAVHLEPEAAKALRRALPDAVRQALSDEQRETLDALFRHNLNVSETARALYIHRNTLLYRLDKLADKTGLDPRQFADAVLLKLAVLFGQTD